MRRAARTDANHRELFDLAAELGGFVIDTSKLGQGKPDGFVWTRRHGWTAVEIKVMKGKLTFQQSDLHARVPIRVWRTKLDVYGHFGVTPA